MKTMRIKEEERRSVEKRCLKTARWSPGRCRSVGRSAGHGACQVRFRAATRPGGGSVPAGGAQEVKGHTTEKREKPSKGRREAGLPVFLRN